jgi:RNA polymerase sigma-70 factor (ECF subfamily)
MTDVPAPASDATFRAEMVAAIPRLRSFARGLCGNRDLADDLAQEALVKAWAARASYKPGTNFRAWLFTILRNHFYSLARRASRFAPWDPDLAARTLITPADQGVNIHFGDLERGLGLLPVEQREALILVTAQGLSYEEAATIMGCAVGTIKSRVARARTALTRYLEGDEPAPVARRLADTRPEVLPQT